MGSEFRHASALIRYCADASPHYGRPFVPQLGQAIYRVRNLPIKNWSDVWCSVLTTVSIILPGSDFVCVSLQARFGSFLFMVKSQTACMHHSGLCSFDPGLAQYLFRAGHSLISM
jgi:hypothetical protein